MDKRKLRKPNHLQEPGCLKDDKEPDLVDMIEEMSDKPKYTPTHYGSGYVESWIEIPEHPRPAQPVKSFNQDEIKELQEKLSKEGRL